jgi:O-antigen/teichoic acid export membrane protein
MISTPLMVIVQGAAYVLFPALARITRDRARFRAACLRSLRLMCAVAFPLGLILIPLGVPSATLIFGDVWRDAGYAAMAAALFPAAGAILSFASESLKADGHPEVLSRMHLVIFIVSAIAMVSLLPFDLVGVAGGVSVGTVAGAAFALVSVSRLIEIPMARLIGEFAPAAAAALIMAAVLTPLEFLVVNAADRGTAIGLVLLAGEGLLGMLIYAGALRLFAPSVLADLMQVVRGALKRDGGAAPSPAEPAPATVEERA